MIEKLFRSFRSPFSATSREDFTLEEEVALYRHRAEVALEEERYSDALVFLAKILRLNPYDLQARMTVAHTYHYALKERTRRSSRRPGTTRRTPTPSLPVKGSARSRGRSRRRPFPSTTSRTKANPTKKSSAAPTRWPDSGLPRIPSLPSSSSRHRPATPGR